MNDNALKWVKALESGKFVQCMQTLSEARKTFCCLGVACEVYNENVEKEHRLEVEVGCGPRASVAYDKESSRLPIKVSNWLGIRTSGGSYKAPRSGDHPSGRGSLTHLNDSGSTFEEIAKLIRSEPEELFQ